MEAGWHTGIVVDADGEAIVEVPYGEVVIEDEKQRGIA